VNTDNKHHFDRYPILIIDICVITKNLNEALYTCSTNSKIGFLCLHHARPAGTLYQARPAGTLYQARPAGTLYQVRPAGTLCQIRLAGTGTVFIC